MNIFENDQATKRTSHWDDDYQEEDAQICSSPLVYANHNHIQEAKKKGSCYNRLENRDSMTS